MSTAPVDPNEACAACGSGEFELHDETRPGESYSSAVHLNAFGSVVFYTGAPRCIACQKPWSAGKRPKLVVVK